MYIKEALDKLKSFRNYNKYYKENVSLTITISFEVKEILNKAIETVLNELDKKDKEIEELKDIVETLRKENVSLYIERRKNDNKIKAKIERLEKYRDKFYERNMLQDVIIKQNQIQVLHSLLERGKR